MELKLLRMKKGLTQESLGSKVGVSAIAIGNYEKGIRSPSYTICEKLALALDTDIIVLVRYFQKNENEGKQQVD